MSSYNVTVDDLDPTVIYSPAGNWQHVTTGLVAEFDGTRSGAAFAGMTATFNFTGSQVFVYGSQGSIDVFGQPKTTYLVDGNSAWASTYVAPYIDPGYYTVHTLFYASPSLPAGPHQLLITNLNGTAPSIYWLDYIIYTVDPNATPSSSSSSSSALPSLPSPSPSPSSVPSSSAPLTPVAGPSSTEANDNSTSKSSTPTGAIVGGVIGGLVLLFAIIFAFLFFRRRNRERIDLGDETPPSKWEGTPTPFLLGSSAHQPPFNPMDGVAEVPSASIPASSTTYLPVSGYNGGEVAPSSVPRSAKRAPAPPTIVAQHADSGVRLPTASASSPPATVTEVPPAYSSL